MTVRLIFLILVLTKVVFGQTPTDQDILEIVKTSLEQGRLPRELVNNVDSLWAVGTKQPYNRNDVSHYLLTVGVEGTKENGLTYHHYIKWNEKEIWVCEGRP